jgi:LemA protein
MWVALVVLLVLLAVSALGVIAFNRLRTSDIAAEEALGGIDVQLTRRADLIPNLVGTVKGYAAHERSVLDEVTEARAGISKATRSGGVEDRAAAQARLDRAIVNVLAVAEAYPDLEASENFLQLQTELAETEGALAFARQYYNDAVRSLNTLVATLPWLLFVGVSGVRRREFYEAPEGREAPPVVEF